ncbi:hypothetical protein ILYODFUR_035117 [Ilyodon furcidens]|uniref:Uncharacterized protein n=1 Tax=Ilyodon furcidens TaxID=33524 RepID=A0ABV0T303_9TELE
MARWSASTRSWRQPCGAQRPPVPLNGATTWGGSNTLTTPMSLQPPAIPLSKPPWDTSPRCSRWRRRTSLFLLYDTTSGDVSGYGTPPAGRFTGQQPKTSATQTVDVCPLLATSLVRRFGSPHGTSHLSPCPESFLPACSDQPALPSGLTPSARPGLSGPPCLLCSPHCGLSTTGTWMSVPRRLGGARSGGSLLGSGFLHHRSLPDPGFPGLPNHVFWAARRRPLRGRWCQDLESSAACC